MVTIVNAWYPPLDELGRDDNSQDDTAPEVERDDYTWEMAVKDLTLMTRLTLSQASTLVLPLRRTDLNPYDAVDALRRLVSSGGAESDPAKFGEALRELITGKSLEWWQ